MKRLACLVVVALCACPPVKMNVDAGRAPECETRDQCDPGKVCTAEKYCDSCSTSGQCTAREECNPATKLCALRAGWIVQGLLKVEDAVSPNLTTLDLLISLIGYTAIYGTLAVAMVKLMLKYAKAGPDAAMHESVDVAPSFAGADD
jgi:hypothetical protein